MKILIGAIMTTLVLFFGSSASAESAMPRSIVADIHLPGASQNRYLNVSIAERGGEWIMSGCVSALQGACNRTRQITLSAADLRRIETEVSLFLRTPISCAQPQRGPNDRVYNLVIDGSRLSGVLPADTADIPSHIAPRVCGAMHRLAWWIVQRFQGS